MGLRSLTVMEYFYIDITSKPIKVIPFDNLGWFTPPDDISIKCSVIDSPNKHIRIRDSRFSIYDSEYSFWGDSKFKLVSWENIIDPPIQPNEIFKYRVEINTPKTEVAAFTGNGTYVGIPANFPIKKASLVFVCPPGYTIELLSSAIVLDSAGDRNIDIESNCPQPLLSLSKTIIQWNIDNLIPKNRYVFKYRFLKSQYSDE